MTSLCDCEGLGCSKCGGEGTYPMDDELTRLRAENERLREELRLIDENLGNAVKQAPTVKPEKIALGAFISMARLIQSRARAALKETSHDG